MLFWFWKLLNVEFWLALTILGHLRIFANSSWPYLAQTSANFNVLYQKWHPFFGEIPIKTEYQWKFRFRTKFEQKTNSMNKCLIVLNVSLGSVDKRISILLNASIFWTERKFIKSLRPSSGWWFREIYPNWNEIDFFNIYQEFCFYSFRFICNYRVIWHSNWKCKQYSMNDRYFFKRMKENSCEAIRAIPLSNLNDYLKKVFKKCV